MFSHIYIYAENRVAHDADHMIKKVSIFKKKIIIRFSCRYYEKMGTGSRCGSSLLILLFSDCPALLVENAMVNPCTGTISHGSSATITCVQGFTIVGKSTVTCLEGKYDSIPSCKADCKTLTIPNAVVRPATKVAHGTTVHVVCSGVNTSVGESMVTCYDGYFKNIPKCVFDISTVKAVHSEKIRIKVKGELPTPSVNGA